MKTESCVIQQNLQPAKYENIWLKPIVKMQKINESMSIGIQFGDYLVHIYFERNFKWMKCWFRFGAISSCMRDTMNRVQRTNFWNHFDVHVHLEAHKLRGLFRKINRLDNNNPDLLSFLQNQFRPINFNYDSIEEHRD